jgi:hypothetical protein
MVDYFNAPSQARLQYQDIFNPFQREALVQTATNNAYLPYKNMTDILSARTGSITDIINAASTAFGAQTTSAKDAATLAQQKINNAQWKYEQTHAKPSTAAPKSALETYIENQILNSINPGSGTGNTGGFTPTVPQPNYTPVQGEGAKDNSGQWIYAKDPDTGVGEWMVNLGYSPTSGGEWEILSQ